MKHFDYEISLFIDKELSDKDQQELFVHITECSNCRNALSDFMKIKDKSKEFFATQVPVKSETLIPLELKKQKPVKNIYQALFYFAAAACLILGFLFLMNISRNNKIDNETTRLKKQPVVNQTNAKNIADQNSFGKELNKNKKKIRELKVSIAMKNRRSQQITKKLNEAGKRNKLGGPKSDYIEYLGSLKTEKVTKNDFIFPPMIGN